MNLNLKLWLFVKSFCFESLCSGLLPHDMRASVGGSARTHTRTEGAEGDTLMGLGRVHTEVVCRAEERSWSLSEALHANKNARHPRSSTRVG